ncbi:alpha/beta hydrolase [Pontibacter sp. G13]|uniref:alpha/beta hydrolase n=1 Tax=Pontibacter sp. G13 TaxID=3074898 RepID=UPI00288BBD23|nr:alpha/beta hydrolase [Pontibacter sp. G13]WNJ18772.1 alpha/beta hydrolase [Pontibacter sp. G13]
MNVWIVRTMAVIGLMLMTVCDGAAQQWMKETYRQLDSSALHLEILTPEGHSPSAIKPAIVFFFGGGWKVGNLNHFRPQAEAFAARGMITVLVEYRTKSSHGVSPFECLEDAKAAIRYIRKSANRLGVDPDRICAAGGSAGGHLAAATSFIQGFEADMADTAISCQPNLLVLYNPVIDNGPAGYGYDRIGDRFREFSPLHNLRENLPPTLFLLGDRDHLIPVETATYFQKSMERLGNICELEIYPGGKHGFFNPSSKNNWFQATLDRADQFLVEQGYLSPRAPATE